MTNILLITIIVLLVISILADIIYMRWIIEAVQNKPEPEITNTLQPFVASSNPALVNDLPTGDSESVIVNPKSPQLVQWEEEQEIAKMNMGKPR